MNCNEEVTIRLVGKLTLEVPQLDQLKIRNIIDEVLVNYEIQPIEKHLVVSDIEEKAQYFLATKKLEGASENTLYNYSLLLIKLASVIHKPVASITVVDMRIFLAIISKNKDGKEKKKGTMNTKISSLKSFFNWLENEEMLIKNPMAKIRGTKKEKHLRKALTQEELESLRDACKTTRQRCILEFLFSTGCRLSELVNVNIEDIKWDKQELSVFGKGSKERMVYINAKAALYIKKYLKEREHIDNLALFIASKYPFARLGRRSVEREIDKIAGYAGFKKSVYPHLVRHTTATLALKGGMNITSIQRILGHENLATTEIYAETDNTDVKYEYNKFLNQ